jgi:hypothetical protein
MQHFGSFAHDGTSGGWYRAARHECNKSVGSDAIARTPLCAPPPKTFANTAFAHAPPARQGGLTVPGGNVRGGHSAPEYVWNMVGVEFSNCFAACTPRTLPRKREAPVTIHVINLSRRPKRWERCTQLNLDKRLKLERYNANTSDSRRGWVGCARSHLALIRAAEQKVLPWVIVAEDDFIPTTTSWLWCNRLMHVLDAIEDDASVCDVFNGLPSGRFSGQLIRPVGSAELGLWEVNGGNNTHFMIYTAAFYARANMWESDFARCEAANASSRSAAEAVMAWDRWVSAAAEKMVTAVPHFTMSAMDTSDIVRGGVINGQMAMHAAELLGALWEPTWFSQQPVLLLDKVRVTVRGVPTDMAGCDLFNTLSTVARSCGAALIKVVGVPPNSRLLREFPRAFGEVNEEGWAARPYELAIEVGWVLRRPLWLAVAQCQNILDSTPDVTHVLLCDLPDVAEHVTTIVPSVAARKSQSIYWRREPQLFGSVYAWRFNPLVPLATSAPTVRRASSSSSQAPSLVLLPGGFSVRTITHSPAKFLPC